jgi:hypothetical protein
VHHAKAFDHVRDGRRLGRGVSRFLEIEIVDDAADPADDWIADRESLGEDFEGASIGFMSEVAAEHVKGHLGISSLIRERKRGTRVDEPANEPR